MNELIIESEIFKSEKKSNDVKSLPGIDISNFWINLLKNMNEIK